MNMLKSKPTTSKAVLDDSSVVSRIEYNAVRKTLDVTFKRNDRTYRYSDVSLRVYNNLRLADSPGNYFNDRIMGRYKYREVL